ncbi:penicillin-binding transpeptidase domain-containing protein [Glutamicibacter creatinolyticus]|uniref:penicillin-binding transpeptidase domain-containing protein n=1 Tax=Glutamicibacter creatinolyticus TaxID=162496 RepID=UPI0037BF8BB4
MRPVLRPLGALTTAALLAATLTSCSESTPEVKPAAEALSAALESDDFSQVPLAAGADTEQVSQVVKETFRRMDGIGHTHTVQSAEVDEEPQGEQKTATAVINTVWDVDPGENDLSYQTNAVFEYDQDAQDWKLRFDPAVLAPGLEEGGYLAARNTAAQRGDILGAKGAKLVTDRPVVRVGIDKTRAEASEWEDSARALAKLVDLDPDDYAKRVAAAGERAWVEAIVLRDDAEREATDEKINAVPGAVATPDELPLAPTRSFARQLLGTVGQATAEIIEKSEGKVKAGDQVGRSGLQAQYNQLLAGTAGTTVASYNSEHEQQDELFSSEPVNGKDLELSLDPKLQQLADSVVADTDSPAALVAVRPSDGAVLAAASGPEDNAYNTALLGKYAPGSSFKVISALAMLRDGATPGTKVDCPATTTVDGKAFKNYDGYPSSALGQLPLSEALAQSCNTVFVEAGADLGSSKVAQAAGSLGLNAQDSTGANAFLGTVPDDSKGTELAANMIGQGVVQASPLGMATVMASVVAGETVHPQLVLTDAQDQQDAGQSQQPSPSTQATELSEDEAKQLRSMMGEVVDHGTLKQLNSVPGGTVIGKSGTAEYDAERNAHAWAIAGQGDLAIAAFVEEGEGGAQTAGPLVREFLTELPR